MSSDLEKLVGQGRLPHLKALCVGTWEGTDGLVATLVSESRHIQAWRPVRAAAAMAAADTETRVWMTPEEWADWMQGAKALAMRLKRGTTHPREDLQIAYERAKKLKSPKMMAKEGLRISKVEALAAAHYLMNFPKPVENGDAEGLSDWFDKRFKSASSVAPFLDVGLDTLGNRLRGYDMVQGRRVPRPPEGYMIRALDWLDRMGPICPYGDRRELRVFPNQQQA